MVKNLVLPHGVLPKKKPLHLGVICLHQAPVAIHPRYSERIILAFSGKRGRSDFVRDGAQNSIVIVFVLAASVISVLIVLSKL